MKKKIWINKKLTGKNQFTGSWVRDGDRHFFVLESGTHKDSFEYNSPSAAKSAKWVAK